MKLASVRRFVICIVILLVSLVGAHAQEVHYIYDELGRLIGVIDQNGDAAVYHYDAVGNLLSITRQSAGAVSIIEFTPNDGPIGTTVKLFGTGFSSTPSQNAVTFNGTVATVTSSTTTEIVVSVPSGATTGTIAVTTPSGSATSAESFTVAASVAPTVTSISPAIGTAGTSVTVSGTNFLTNTTQDRVTFNVGQAQVASATSTSIGTTVSPTSISGHISVATPYGAATSSADFYVPPGSYTASDVIVTDRMTTAASKSVTIGTASKIGLVLFDGAAGQYVSLKISTGVVGLVSIYDHHRKLIATTGVGVAEAFIDPILVPAAATYMIVVDPNGTNTGSLTLTLYNIVDVTGTITAGGSSVGVTTTTPGQKGRLTFSGTAGDRVVAPSGFRMLIAPLGPVLAFCREHWPGAHQGLIGGQPCLPTLVVSPLIRE